MKLRVTGAMLLCFLLVAMSLGSEPEQQTHSCEHGGDGVSLLSFRSMKGGRADTFNSSAGQGGEIDMGVDQEAEALEMIMDYEQLYAEAVGMVPEELTNACKSMDRNSDGEITEEDFQEAPKDAWPEFQKTFNGQNDVVTMAECISGETNMYLDRLDEAVAAKMMKAAAKLQDAGMSAQDVADDLSAIRRGAKMPGGLIQTLEAFKSETIEFERSKEEEDKEAFDIDVREPEQLLEDEEKRGGSEIEMDTNIQHRRRRREGQRSAVYNADTSYSDQQSGRKAVHNAKINYNDVRYQMLLNDLTGEAAAKVWSSVNLMLKVMTSSDYCWRKSYDRGGGWLKECPSPYHRHGLFCYKDCKSGYRKVGDVCWKDCPHGTTDIGVDCIRWVRHTEWWRSWLTWPHFLGKESYWELPKGVAGFGVCPSQRPIDIASLCYATPKSGYSCTLTACNEDCKEPLATNCGAAACAASTQACVSNVVSMITSAIQATVDTAMMIATAGGSAALQASLKASMTAATKISLRKAAKASATKMFNRVKEGAFKDMWVKFSTEKAKKTLMTTEPWKRLFSAFMGGKLAAMGKLKALTNSAAGQAAKGNFFEWLKQTSATEMVASVEADMTNLEKGTGFDKNVVTYAEEEVVTQMLSMAGLGPLAGPLVNQMEKNFEKAKEDPGAFLEKLDFTGMTAAIRKTADADATPVAKMKAWASALSTFDPTGWIGVAANFMHPICDDQHKTIEANKDSESDAETTTKNIGSNRGNTGNKKR